MNRPIEINVNGIKCDAEGCDYENLFGSWGTTTEEISSTTKKWVNEPCPKCGAPLLTEEDAALIHEILDMIKNVDHIVEMMDIKVDDPDIQKLDIELDGSGTAKIKPFDNNTLH